MGEGCLLGEGPSGLWLKSGHMRKEGRERVGGEDLPLEHTLFPTSFQGSFIGFLSVWRYRWNSWESGIALLLTVL